MAFSVALVVCVLSGFLSMAVGFETALKSAGSPTVAVVLGGGTNQEVGSDVPADVIRTIEAMRDDFGVLRDRTSKIAASREIVVPVEMNEEPTGQTKVLALRGMDPAGPSLRMGSHSQAGRHAVPGSREIVVGKQIASAFRALAVGQSVRLGSVNWIVAVSSLPVAVHSNPNYGATSTRFAPPSTGKAKCRAFACGLRD